MPFLAWASKGIGVGWPFLLCHEGSMPELVPFGAGEKPPSLPSKAEWASSAALATAAPWRVNSSDKASNCFLVDLSTALLWVWFLQLLGHFSCLLLPCRARQRCRSLSAPAYRFFWRLNCQGGSRQSPAVGRPQAVRAALPVQRLSADKLFVCSALSSFPGGL